MRRASVLLLAVLSLSLGGCGGGGGRKPVADGRVGQTFYLCCNLRFDPKNPEVSDAGAAGGGTIPFATRVEVQKVTRSSVVFQAAGHPPITVVYEHGGKGASFEQFLSRLFVTDDPRLKLKKVPARLVKQIEKGVVAPGMTRDQVAMAIGFPPGDRTPSLDAATWAYASGFTVSFAGSQVASVHQGSSPPRRTRAN